MKKTVLASVISNSTGVAKVTVEKVINSLIDEVTASVANGESVTLRGLGVFKRKAKAARYARNPSTGAEVFVPAHNAPVFTASKDFKEGVK